MDEWVGGSGGCNYRYTSGRKCAQRGLEFPRNLSPESMIHPFVRERKMLCIDSGGERAGGARG